MRLQTNRARKQWQRDTQQSCIKAVTLLMVQWIAPRESQAIDSFPPIWTGPSPSNLSQRDEYYGRGQIPPRPTTRRRSLCGGEWRRGKKGSFQAACLVAPLFQTSARMSCVVTNKLLNNQPWGPGTPWPPIPLNSSWLIAHAMPRVIFRDGARPDIRVVLYPKPVPSSWHAVREAVPRFWDGDKSFFCLYRDPDTPANFPVAATLHMGMLDEPKEAFRLEKNGYKHGYKLPDEDGKYPDHDDLTGGGTWEGVPDKLSTDLDIEAIHQKVKSEVKVYCP